MTAPKTAKPTGIGSLLSATNVVDAPPGTPKNDALDRTTNDERAENPPNVVTTDTQEEEKKRSQNDRTTLMQRSQDHDAPPVTDVANDIDHRRQPIHLRMSPYEKRRLKALVATLKKEGFVSLTETFAIQLAIGSLLTMDPQSRKRICFALVEDGIVHNGPR